MIIIQQMTESFFWLPLFIFYTHCRKLLESFHVYSLIKLKVWRDIKVCRQEPLQKNTTLITFDKVMVLWTSNLEHYYTCYVKLCKFPTKVLHQKI